MFLSVLGLFLFISLGCDDVERHRFLTFFFDGVPPLVGEEEIIVVDPNATDQRRVRPEVVWYIHEPQKECATCHGEKKKRTFSAAVQLVAKPPELCYECHEGMRELQGRGHGPVLAGECLLCHDPHKTRNEHLLKKAVPEMCYQCHNQQAIVQIGGGHGQEHYSKCLDCHVGHASEGRYLLKEETAGIAEPNDVQVGDPNSLGQPSNQ